MPAVEADPAGEFTLGGWGGVRDAPESPDTWGIEDSAPGTPLPAVTPGAAPDRRGNKKSSHRRGRNLWKPWSRGILAPMLPMLVDNFTVVKIFCKKFPHFDKTRRDRESRAVWRFRMHHSGPPCARRPERGRAAGGGDTLGARAGHRSRSAAGTHAVRPRTTLGLLCPH